MKYFNIEQIIKNQTNLNITKKYNQYDNVQFIDIDKNQDGYMITSTVNVLGKQETCHIQLNHDQDITSYECGCSWCDSISPCAHIGATLLKINELSIEKFPFSYLSTKYDDMKKEYNQRKEEIKKEQLLQKSQLSRELIQKNKTIYNTNIYSLFQNEKYELEPILSFSAYDDFICLKYKIGNKKKYVIKNIPDFINRIEQKQLFSYGKELQFIHSKESFDKFALKQIDFIKKAQVIYNKKINQYYYYYRSPQLSKEIPIMVYMLDDFFETYKDYDFDNCQLHELDEKIKIQVLEDEDTYTLSLRDSHEYIIGNKHIYTYYKDDYFCEIGRMCLDNEGIAISLIQSLLDEDIVILKEEYHDFYKFVLSPIIEYFDILNLVEMKNSYNDSIQIYGDVDNQSQVYFKIYYYNENQNRVLGFNKELITDYTQDIVENYICHYASNIDYEKHIAYFDIDEEKTYEFINEGIDFLQEYAEIYVSENLKKIGKHAHYSIQIGVRVENDLLALDIESAQIPHSEMSNILEQYKRKKKFYRLKSGELLYLNSPELEELETFMEQYHILPNEIDDGKITLSKNRMFSLDNDGSKFQHINLDRKETYKKTLNQFQQRTTQDYPIHPSYETILRDYQKDGYIWMRTLNDYGFNGILADDMGLGKTLQVISLLESINTEKPSLVVCPSSLIYNWEDEVHKFSKSLKVQCVVGNQETRKSIIQNSFNGQLFVTSYDYMRRDYELYEQTQFEYLILDEAQYIKNQKTKNAISVKKINALHKLALTGTPIENSLAELWSIFDFLMPKYLYNYNYFKTYFENDIVKNQDQKKIEQLRQMVSPFILRRNKKDVLKELPDKVERTQIIPFNEEESQLYYATLAQANEELQAIFKMENVDSIAILALLTRLRQICQEPRIVYENIHNISSKMKACLDLIFNFKENNQKVLLFSSFTSVLDLLAEELSIHNISYYRITGDTSKEKRREYVEGFQNGNVDVFLISLKAGGTGLNLTKAEAVIHYDPWWNVSAQNQATDRAYRIGQEKNVQVFKLVMKDSIEEKIVKLQEKKKEIADMFVENNTGSISCMSKEEILELFS